MTSSEECSYEVSEHSINDSAPFKSLKTIKSPTACFTVRIIRGGKLPEKIKYSDKINKNLNDSQNLLSC